MISRRTKYLVILVVSAGSLLTVALSASLGLSLIENWHLSLGRDADMVSAVLEEEVEKFVFGLEGARGALIANNLKEDRQSFKAYAASRNYFSNFPGALGFGFIRRVPKAEMAEYEARQRRERPQFEIHPRLDAGPHMVIEFIEPEEANRPALGLDVAFEARRRAAADESARTGKPILSKKISLVQASMEHHGFLYFLPVYKSGITPPNEADRLRELIGWVYSPLVLDKLFASASARLPQNIYIHLTSASDDVNISLGEDIPESTWPSNWVDRSIEVTGRKWNVRVYESTNSLLSSLLEVGLAGFFGVLLLGMNGLALYTGIRKQERHLSKQKTWLEAIIQSTKHSVIAVRPDGVISTFNRAAEKMLGYSASEVIGKFTPEAIHDTNEIQAHAERVSREVGRPVQPGIEAFVAKTETDGVDANEWTYITKNGDRIPVRLTVTAVHDPSGSHLGYVGVAEDLTEQKQLLETIEGQRLKMIESSKLSLLGEMAGGIAHEINSPLTVIIGNAEALTDGAASGTYPAVVETPARAILNTAWRIAKIVKALRQFSRDATHDPMTELSLKNVVDSTLDLCRERLERAGIAIKVDVQPSLLVSGREVELSQVLMNLISNAMDAVAGQPNPWIEICASASSSGRIQLSVTDSGSGIPKTIADKIMLPFFTTKQVGKGTGLGLSISKNIVESHYGALILDEQSSHTRFVVDLPPPV